MIVSLYCKRQVLSDIKMASGIQQSLLA